MGCVSILDVSLIGLEWIGISRHLVVWIIVIANRVLWGVVWHVRDSNPPGKVKTGFSVDRGRLPANSGSCAQVRLRGHHLGAAAALEGRKYSDAAAAGVADRNDAVFDGDAALALALFT